MTAARMQDPLPDRVAPSEALEIANRRTWAKPAVLRAFGDDASSHTDWWSDPGERAAILTAAPLTRSEPILEVGVGGGRLVPILRVLSDAYVGIDYTPEMVGLCRRRFPEADVRLGDARDLSDFPDGEFQLVVFTFNGIDAIAHDDRSVALAEFRRVLRPAGYLVYSTHNKQGPCFTAKPWHRAGPPQKRSWTWQFRLVRFTAAAVGHPASLPRSLWNWRRGMRQRADHGDWGVGPVEAHDFDRVVHFETLARARRELEAAGFAPVAAFAAEDGRLLDEDADLHGVRYFHLIARAI